jgi:hypothetical protein
VYSQLLGNDDTSGRENWGGLQLGNFCIGGCGRDYSEGSGAELECAEEGIGGFHAGSYLLCVSVGRNDGN